MNQADVPTILVVGALLCSASPAVAQWEETALTNTTINSLLWTGDELFATGYSDVYWTTDDGDTWSSSGTGLESTGGIYALAKKDNKLFVGANDGIYRSLNNGMTWQELTFSGNYVRAVAVKGSYVYAGYSGGARRTSDDGNTWVATTGLGGDVYHMHVVDDYVFIGTYNGGVARLSADDLAWTSASSGLTDLQIRGITSNGSDVFVGTSSQGIFRSIDYGQTWVPVNNGIPSIGLIIKALHAHNGVLLAATYAGVFISTNNGDSWSVFNDGLGTAMECLSANDSWYFAGDYDVWRRSPSDVGAGLQSEEQIRLSCYPNPTTDVLHITGDIDRLDPGEIQVLSLDGRILKRHPSIESRSSHRLTLDMSELPTGCFLLQLSSHSTVTRVMFKKNH